MPKRRGTVVKFPDGQTVVFQEKLSEAVAIKRALKARKAVQNPVSDPVQHAMERFREFNNKEPRELATLDLNLSKTPLINMGSVPEIHYTSRKEGGKPIHYVHFLKKKGTLYGHPDGGLFVTIAPSTRVDDWLRENPSEDEAPKNISEGINRAIANAVKSIRSYIGDGWGKQAAIDFVRAGSSLGPKSWELVLATVTKEGSLPTFRSTEEAIEFGKTATVEQRRKLQDRREVNLELAHDAKLAKRYNDAIKYATTAQFDREALEAGITDKRLIAENIDKATLRWEALSETAKAKVKSKKGWIMKVAWQIQRGRIKGYGHK